jgi:hypothetical protein
VFGGIQLHSNLGSALSTREAPRLKSVELLSKLSTLCGGGQKLLGALLELESGDACTRYFGPSVLFVLLAKVLHEILEVLDMDLHCLVMEVDLTVLLVDPLYKDAPLVEDVLLALLLLKDWIAGLLILTLLEEPLRYIHTQTRTVVCGLTWR